MIGKEEQERAVLVGLITQNQTEVQAEEYLDELAFLAETAGAIEQKRFTQKLGSSHPKTFVGSGKLKEIADYIKKHEIGLIIFDDELSPSQTRNIENAFKEIKVLDRSKLILDIFAKRARTAAAKTQVELAQYEYLLPRLTRMWTHLSRQKGGIGMRGPGETEIETDRRIIRDKIALLKSKLQKIDKQKATQRKGRQQMIRAALVGYTNVGKSTLLNALLNEERAIVSDIAGTTRDTVEDQMVIGGISFRFIDTAGIRQTEDQVEKIGIQKAFEKIEQAALVLHLIDGRQQNQQEIKELQKKYPHKNIWIVANKIDEVPLKDQKELLEKHSNISLISAKNKRGITELKETLLKLSNTGELGKNDVVITNNRHYDALLKALKAIEKVKEGLENELASDLMAIDVREALFHLGEITGQVTTDDLLGNIFSNFCIGK